MLLRDLLDVEREVLVAKEMLELDLLPVGYFLADIDLEFVGIVLNLFGETLLVFGDVFLQIF